MKRISTNMPNYDMSYYMRLREWKMNELQNKMASQTRLKNLRDDPLAAGHATRYQSKVVRLERFIDNISKIRGDMALAEGNIRSGLDILHYVAPALGGFLLPLAWYLALSRFVRSPLAAVTGTAAIFACLCLDGTPRSFGSYGFPAVRLGKGMLMAAFVPIFVAFSKDWFERPGVENALKLLLVAAALASSRQRRLPARS